MAAIVGGRLRELTYALEGDAAVTPLDATTADGVRVYRRSLALLMLVAFDEACRQRDLHRALGGDGGRLLRRGARAEAVQRGGAATVERRMRQVVAEDAPITRERVTRQRRSRSTSRAARRTRHGCWLTANGIGSLVPPARAARLPAGLHGAPTGCLTHFSLHTLPTGFMLRFPHQRQPDVMAPLTPYPNSSPCSSRPATGSIGWGSAAPGRSMTPSRETGPARCRWWPRRSTSRHRPHRQPHRGDPRAHPGGVHRGPQFVRQDDVCKRLACSCWPMGSGRCARPRRLLRRPRRDPARREGESTTRRSEP